jgi:hypothetical protein
LKKPVSKREHWLIEASIIFSSQSSRIIRKTTTLHTKTYFRVKEEATYYAIDGADENGKYIIIAETFCTNDQTFYKASQEEKWKNSKTKFHTMETINELQLQKCATQSCTNKKRVHSEVQ